MKTREAFFRRLKTLIAAALVASQTGVYASPVSEANDKLEESLSRARDKAKLTFAGNMMDILAAELIPLAGSIKSIQDEAKKLSESLRNTESDFLKGDLSNLNSKSLMIEKLMASKEQLPKKLESAMNDFLYHYDKTFSGARLFVDKIRSHQAASAEANDRVRAVISKINLMCEKGVSQDYLPPILEPTRFTSPQMTFRFNLDGNTNTNVKQVRAGESREPEGFGAQFFPIFDELGGMGYKMDAAVSYTLPVAFGTLFNSLLHMPWLAASGAGLGVTIAIGVMILMIQDGINRDAATEAANAAERFYTDRPTSLTIAQYYKEACGPLRRKLDEVPVLAQQIASSGPDSTLARQFNERTNEAKQKYQEYIRLYQQNRAQYFHNEAGIDDNEMNLISEALAVYLTQILIQSASSSVSLNSVAKAQFEDANSILTRINDLRTEMRKRRDSIIALINWLYLSESGSDLLLNDQSRLERDLLAFQHEWMAILIQYAEDQFLARPVVELQRSTGHLLKRMRAYAASYGASPLLSSTIARSQALLEQMKGSKNYVD